MKIRSLLLISILALAAGARAEDLDTVYLRDGSVVNGKAVRRDSGDYRVQLRFGVLNINAKDVILIKQHETPPPIIEESHFFIDDTTRTLSVVMQDIPERTDDSGAFNLLMPGEVESILTDSGSEIKHESRRIGDNTLVTIDYPAVPIAAKRIRIVLWQENLLARPDSKTAKFQRQYTPDREGMIYITIKYPKEWKVRVVTPQPANQFEGLIVWRQSVPRQQEFTPEAVFEIARN